jgi:hypothetical protein
MCPCSNISTAAVRPGCQLWGSVFPYSTGAMIAWAWLPTSRRVLEPSQFLLVVSAICADSVGFLWPLLQVGKGGTCVWCGSVTGCSSQIPSHSTAQRMCCCVHVLSQYAVVPCWPCFRACGFTRPLCFYLSLIASCLQDLCVALCFVAAAEALQPLARLVMAPTLDW